MLTLASASAATAISNLFPFQGPTGHVATFNVNGAIDTSNPFFQSLGTNGRTCASCHVTSDGFSLRPSNVQARFASSGGTDPLFAAIDGANCPDTRDEEGLDEDAAKSCT